MKDSQGDLKSAILLAALRSDVLRKINLILFAVLLFSYPVALIGAPSAPTKKTRVRLTEAVFFVVDKQGKRHVSNSIDYSKHSSYGWSIDFDAKPGKHTIKEVIQLPGPANWGVGQNTTISTNQTSATSTYPVASETRNFVFQNMWSYAPGDPSGVYTFDIFVDNVLVKSFIIDVKN